MKYLVPWLVVIAALSNGCASKTSKSTEAETPSSPPFESAPEEVVVSIDTLALSRALGLERAIEILGFTEKSFDTCRVGYGYSALNNCHREFFAVIHFQILCRDSEGTVSEAIAHSALKPLSGRTVNWSIQNTRGSLQLDGLGHGQILTTFPKSARSDRLKLLVDGDFVYVRAGEVKRLVTPKNWCN